MVGGLALKRRRDIRQQRLQFAAVLTTIVLGVMMFAASYDAYQNLNLSYQGTYDRLALADATVAGMSRELTTDLEAIDGVAAVTERRVADVPVRVGGDSFIGRVVSMPLDDLPDVGKIEIQNGEYLADSAQGAAESHMAAHFETEAGDTIEVLTATGWLDVEITGDAVSPEYLWPARSSQVVFEPPGQFGVVFVSEDVLDAIDPTQVTAQTLVLYEEDVDTEALDDEVTDVALDAGASDVELQADQPSNKALELDVKGFEQMAVFFPVMFLLVAGMAAYTLLTRVVYSQRSVIGTLRANGFGSGEVTRHYLSYGLWLGMVGSVVGLALGVPAGWAMSSAYTAELGIPDTVREFRIITPIAGLMFGVVVGQLSAWVPARSAVRLSPAEAIRGDASAQRGGVSLLERIFPPLKRAPVQLRMVLRSIGRSKRRSFSVIIAVILAVTMVFTTWGMVDTVTILLTRHFTEVQIQDADIVPAVPVDDALIERIQDIDGVESAEAVVVLEASLRGDDGTYGTTLFAYEEGTETHGFGDDGEGLPDEGVLVGEAILDKIGVEVGDEIRLTLPGLDSSFEVGIAGVVDEPMGSPAYIERAFFEEKLKAADLEDWDLAISQPGVSIVQAVLDEDANRETVVDEIAEIDGIASVVDSQALYDLIDDYMGLFYLMVGMMLGFGGVLALALIFNVVSVNLAERTGEIATMRANGLSHRRIGAFVLAENSVLTAMGIVPGMAIAYWAATALMNSYASDILSFELQAKPSTIWLSALSMFLISAVSLWPGIRAVRKMDIATEVRERSQ